jgi:hypothetical protein
MKAEGSAEVCMEVAGLREQNRRYVARLRVLGEENRVLREGRREEKLKQGLSEFVSAVTPMRKLINVPLFPLNTPIEAALKEVEKTENTVQTRLGAVKVLMEALRNGIEPAAYGLLAPTSVALGVWQSPKDSYEWLFGAKGVDAARVVQRFFPVARVSWKRLAAAATPDEARAVRVVVGVKVCEEFGPGQQSSRQGIFLDAPSGRLPKARDSIVLPGFYPKTRLISPPPLTPEQIPTHSMLLIGEAKMVDLEKARNKIKELLLAGELEKKAPFLGRVGFVNRSSQREINKVVDVLLKKLPDLLLLLENTWEEFFCAAALQYLDGACELVVEGMKWNRMLRAAPPMFVGSIDWCGEGEAPDGWGEGSDSGGIVDGP